MLSFFTKGNAQYKQLATDFSFKNIEGGVINLSDFTEKVILVVNVASRCGFTNQYEDLQKLWTTYKKQGLVVIGVPSDNFRQEPGSNKEIKDFCETNFNITFPMTGKVDVKGKNSHEIYKWAKDNYGSSTVPKWNFHKILINKEGKIHNTFNSFVTPLSKKIINEIELIL